MAKLTSALCATIEKNIEQGKTYKEIAALTELSKILSVTKLKTTHLHAEPTMQSILISAPNKKRIRKIKTVLKQKTKNYYCSLIKR